MNSQIAITLLKDLEQSLDDYCELNDEGKTAFSMAITALELFGNSEQLPSVQPELSNNSPELDKEIGELISREEAIKAVKFYETFCDPYPRVIEALEELPSAQPERTCVNCGRTANNGGWYADGGTRCPIEEHYALPKDGYCHLWEKRNVTDDDYLERRTDDKINKGSSC